MNIVWKDFKVVSVSENHNSFGLYGVVLLAKDGTAYEVAMGSLYKPAKGDTLACRVINDRLDTILGKSYELPRRLDDAPKEVIDLIWNTEPMKGFGDMINKITE